MQSHWLPLSKQTSLVNYVAALLIALFSSAASAVTIEGPFMGHVTIQMSCAGGGSNPHCRLMQKQGSTWKQIAIFYNASGLHSLTLTTGTHNFRQDNYAVGSMGQPTLLSSQSFSVVVPTTPTQVEAINVPASDIDGRLVINWSAVSGSTSYTVEQSMNSNSWTHVYSGNEVTYAAVLDPGSYKFRVKACRSTLCTAYTTSSSLTVASQQPNNASRVLFIHTDLLGSPAVETDANGNMLN